MRALTLAALLVAAIAAPAVADGPQGIRFDQMPVGCAIHTRHGADDKRITVYVGRKGGKHVTQTYASPGPGKPPTKVINTITHDAMGRMVRRDWSDGNWETFTPYSCFDLPGQCRYRYRTGDGADQEYVGSVTAKGKGYVSKGGFRGEAPFADNTFTLGPFNNMATFREGASSFKVTSYADCGGVGS